MLPGTLKTPQRLEDLKDAACKLGIEISYASLYTDDFPIQSGFCRLMGRPMVILDRELDLGRQMDILLDALRKFDLDRIYLPMWIREQVDAPASETAPS